MLDPGRLRDRITLQCPNDSAGYNAAGQQKEKWHTVGTTRAEVLGVGGGETRKGDQPVSIHTHRITVRWRQDITSDWRVIWKGRIINLDRVGDEEGTRETLVLMGIETGEV